MKVKIRKATLNDCDAICNIHVSSIRELGKSHYSEEEVDAWSRGRTPERYTKNISERHVIIAEHNSIPVGFGTLDLATGEIVQLYIRPEYSRKHVGTRILESLMATAREAGIEQVHLISSLNAVAFYVHAGFQPGPKIKHQFPDGGEVDSITMKRFIKLAGKEQMG